MTSGVKVNIRCQGQHEVLTQFILDKDVTYQDGKINQLRLWSEVENALAFEVKNDETDKLILLLSEDIGVGEKLCLVDGTKMRGKCLVYDKINERMIRLQC